MGLLVGTNGLVAADNALSVGFGAKVGTVIGSETVGLVVGFVGGVVVLGLPWAGWLGALLTERVKCLDGAIVVVFVDNTYRNGAS